MTRPKMKNELSTNIKLKSEEYNRPQIRQTHLDVFLENSAINKSEFRGFMNLLLIFTSIYILTTSINNYIKMNRIFRSIHVLDIFNDSKHIIVYWVIYNFFTYPAFLFQIFYYLGVHYYIVCFLQYSIEFLLFGFTTYICFFYNYSTNMKTYFVCQTFIHYFKMHSYFLVNLEYKENYYNNQIDNQNANNEKYPNNLTIRNFLYFLACPTFVYQDSYPRKDQFSLKYFSYKLISGLITLVLMYLIYTEYVRPELSRILEISFFEMLINIYIPFFCLTVLFFFFTFECMCPAYAELTHFGDRLFYDDFWNSTDQEEFSRKWNRVVHNYLFKHVYSPLIKKYHFSKRKSRWFTYFYSAILHEYLLIMVFWVFSPFMTAIMMFQIPLIHFTKKTVSGTVKGNYLFWVGPIIGVPFIFVYYNRLYFQIYGMNK